jgi:hypothetical protein
MEASVWLSNAPHGCWTKPDLTPAVAEQGEDGAREMLAAFGFVPSALIVPECGGFVEATLPDAAAARACVRALHGQAWRGRELVAVWLPEARLKMRVHRRIKATIRAMTAGTTRASATGAAAAGGGAGIADADAAAVMEVEAEEAEEEEAEEAQAQVATLTGEVVVTEAAALVAAAPVALHDDGRAPPRPKRRKRPKPAGPRRAPPRSFHNFTSEKRVARGGHVAQSMLRSCTWGIAGDLRSRGEGGAAGGAVGGAELPGKLPGNLGAAMEAAMEAAPWLATDWVVLRFAAKSFAPQQVRRMAGVVGAIVSGSQPPEYLERCFGAATVSTPLLPSEHLWLAGVQLLADSEEWRGTQLQPELAASHQLRAAIEESVTRRGVQAWLGAARALSQ